MELKKITENCYYFSSATNIGLLKKGNDVLLIDAGLEKGTAKAVLRLLNENDWTLTHILITHAHADHFGGAQHLQEKTGAKIFSTPFEKAILENPLYEPFYLFGGAYPIKELCNKFLQAPTIMVDQEIELGQQTIDCFELEIIPLPGHTLGQFGIKYEGVLYLADALFAEEILKKHGIPYFVDLDLAQRSFDLLEQIEDCLFFLPSHGQAFSSIKDLVRSNRQYLYEILNIVREALPGDSQDIFQKTLAKLKIKIDNPAQYHLLRAAFLAYLSYLSNNGEALCLVEDNKLKWKKNAHPDKHPVER